MFQYEVDEEIKLKLIKPEDAPALFHLTIQSRDELREWLPWVDGMKTQDDSLKFIKWSNDAFEARKALNCGVFYKGELSGMVSFNSVDWTNRIANIGYWLTNDAQGKGIITRAVRGLTDYAFYDLGLNRVDIRAAVGNKKSRAIPERLGFKQEGILRQTEWIYDHFVDHVVYGMLKADWN